MIKICGLRRVEDIEYANLLKPDYIGFIFATSKRQISKEEARQFKEMLSSEIKTVGIFVNQDIDDIIDISKTASLDVVQLHGDEDQIYVDKLRESLKEIKRDIEVWKAIRVKNIDSLEEIKSLKVDGILLDTYSKEAYGGLGESFDWDIVRGLKTDTKLILAGGIDENNIKEAKGRVKPDIIDVSSGVETDGFKDYKKMKLLIERGR